jgi:diguanylate cyclase
MIALLDDFYPLPTDLKAKADSIHIRCDDEIEQVALEAASTAFLSFIKGLKGKIADDFRSINSTFLIFLDHVKELERTLTTEFAGGSRIKDIEQFEMRVNSEMGSIADSFNVYVTIDEVKKTVLEKLKKIKQLLSKRKQEEMRRTKKSQDNINRLRKRISQAEQEALEMSRKAKKFQVAATKDGLTGLYNRKAFDGRIEVAMEAFDDGGTPFSLLLFDVDGFKSINDTFGHVAGDKVLKEIAECLKETFRKDDFIARYGGDEFAVVVEDLSEEMAQERIQRFRETFKKKRFLSHVHGDVQVSVTAGIAMAVEGESPEDLIHRADMTMYAAKKEKD